MASQWFLFALIGIVVLVYVRRFLIERSLKHYSPADIVGRLGSDRSLVLLDVRSSGERQHSHIEGSLHIPLHQITRRSDELTKHREKEIVCYCQTGSRSVTAASRLKKLGFKTANLKGGIAEWNFHNRM